MKIAYNSAYVQIKTFSKPLLCVSIFFQLPRNRYAERLILRNKPIIVSASLSIRIAEKSAYVTEMSSHVCLSAHRYCGKTADWIQMPFGVVSGVGLGRGVLDFGGDRRREGADGPGKCSVPWALALRDRRAKNI